MPDGWEEFYQGSTKTSAGHGSAGLTMTVLLLSFNITSVFSLPCHHDLLSRAAAIAGEADDVNAGG